MTQEDKELLLKDLCGRLLYGVMCDRLGHSLKLVGVHPNKEFALEFDRGEYMPTEYTVDDVKPYLRPMSSMTMEEKIELCTRAYAPDEMKTIDEKLHTIKINAKNATDFYNEHHLDFRGLIEMDLALPAPEGMYNIK